MAPTFSWFHTGYHCQLAFIDFGSAVLFPPDTTNHIVKKQSTSPPTEFAAPEQDIDSDEGYDMFLADIYNLGKVLQSELSQANHVCHDRHRLALTGFSLSV